MTRKELDWILGKVSDFMMLAKVDGKHKIYDVVAFSNPENYKVPVRFQLDGNNFDYLVLDYNLETVLKDCNDVTEKGKSVTLNCDNSSGKKSVIEYTLDDELTFKLHKHLSSYFEV